MTALETITQNVIEECQRTLKKRKIELLNFLKEINTEFINSSVEKVRGDEVDQSTRLMDEQRALYARDRARTQIYEVDAALARIERGDFGYCEETGELIEKDRLLSLPWTRLSVEGAELRERASRQKSRVR